MYLFLKLNCFSILFIFLGMISLLCRKFDMNSYLGVHIKKTLLTQTNYEKGNLLAGYLDISLGILLFVLNTLLYFLCSYSNKILILNFLIFLICSVLISFYVNSQLKKNREK